MTNERDLKTCIIAVAIGKSVPVNLAVEIADDVMTRFEPKDSNRVQRDAHIRAEFNGRNHAELMRKHQISKATLYRIIG